MNRRVLIYGAVVIGAVVVISSLIRLAGFNQVSEVKELPKQPVVPSSRSITRPANASTPSTSPPGASNAPPLDNASLKKLLQEMLRQRGIKEKPPMEKYMHDEIASGDQGRILRAFNDAVYMRYWPMSDVIPVLKGYLSDPTPFIRYLAAQDFLIMGDNNGYSTLVGLVQSKTPLEGLEGTGDLRVQAAVILGQNRQSDAVDAIAALYSQTPNAELSQALANIGAQVPGENQMPFVASELALTQYAKGRASQFIPQITSTFYNTQKPDLKAAAAWALATMNNNPNAIDYLVQTAQAGLNDPSQTGSVSKRNVINYLGSIQTPAAKQTLEAALDSSDPGIVQIAAVNLIFNQGGSAKVNQMVAQAFTPASNPLGVNMALNLAPLLSDPQVQAAGENFSQHDGSGAWQRALDRKDWSIYNWAGGIYFVKPKK